MTGAENGATVVNFRSEETEDFDRNYQESNLIKRQDEENWDKGQGQQAFDDQINEDVHRPRDTDSFGDPGNLVDTDLRYPDQNKIRVFNKDKFGEFGHGWMVRSSQTAEDFQVNEPFDGQFKFASYFADNMVLQREPHRVLVWGYAPVSMVGQKVGVEVSNRLKQYVTLITTDGERGKWEVRIDPYSSSGPHDISASLGLHNIWLRGVLFGDIWMCAGSQILAMPSQSTDFISNNLENIDIRTYIIPTVTSKELTNDVSSATASWNVPSKYTLSQFSAACWAFGLRLHQRLGRPIGLVQATAPDSKIVSWLPPGTQDDCYRDLSHVDELLERSVVFNGMIHPHLKMAIHGILWYHGESDNTNPSLYGCYLPSLISSWDTVWDTGMQSSMSHQQLPSIPWAIVQLGATEETGGSWAGDLRWAQTGSQGYLPNKIFPSTFMAVTVDITHISSNHSVILDAGTLSKRLLIEALNIVYPVEARLPNSVSEQPPKPSNVKVMDDSITVTYNLELEDESLDVRSVTGFEVCCTSEMNSNCKWHQSTIVSQSVTSVAVGNPCSVRQKTSGLRYLWAAAPCKALNCAIYCKDSNLPASPWMWTFSNHEL